MKVKTIFEEIIKNDLLEDRREYDVELLMTSYRLTELEATELEALIQAEFK